MPDLLPILGLSDIVIFPGMVAPLLVETAQSTKLIDDVVGGEWRHAKALPERGPQHALVADVTLQDHQHLAKGFRQHVDVSDRRLFAFARSQNRIQHFERSHTVFAGDGIRQFV